MQAHRDVVRGRLGARPAQVHILTHDKLERARQRGLHRGDVDLAVALSRMAVADLKQRAPGMNGNVQRSARNEILVVQIAGVDPRRSAADSPVAVWGRYTHASEKWPKRYLDQIRETGQHPLAIERDNLRPGVRKIVRQEAGSRPETIVSKGGCQFDCLNPNLQHIARFGTVNIHRTSEDVPSRSPVGNLLVDIAKGVGNLAGWSARRFQSSRAAGGDGLDLHRIA